MQFQHKLKLTIWNVEILDVMMGLQISDGIWKQIGKIILRGGTCILK